MFKPSKSITPITFSLWVGWPMLMAIVDRALLLQY